MLRISRRRLAAPINKEVAMTHSALRVSAIALGVAAFVSLSPLSAASAETVPHPTSTAHGQVAHTYSHHYTRHYNGPAGAAGPTGPTGPVAAAGTTFPTGCLMCRILGLPEQ